MFYNGSVTSHYDIRGNALWEEFYLWNHYASNHRGSARRWPRHLGRYKPP